MKSPNSSGTPKPKSTHSKCHCLKSKHTTSVCFKPGTRSVKSCTQPNKLLRKSIKRYFSSSKNLNAYNNQKNLTLPKYKSYKVTKKEHSSLSKPTTNPKPHCCNNFNTNNTPTVLCKHTWTNSKHNNAHHSTSCNLTATKTHLCSTSYARCKRS